MLVSAASARHPMPLSSRRRSPALPPVTDPTRIALKKAIEVTSEAPDENLPAARLAQCSDHEMAVRRLVFGRFAVSIAGNRLYGRAWESRSTERATCPRSSPRNDAFRPARQQPRANGVAETKLARGRTQRLRQSLEQPVE
jgi:hypothetical protein